MSTATRVERLSSHMHIFVCTALIAIIMVPCVLYVLLEEKDIEIKLSVMGPLSHWIMGMINYCLLLMRSSDIHECVLHMETAWRLVRRIDDQDVMLRYATIGRFVAGLCAIFMHSGIFSHSVLQGTTPTFEIIDNVGPRVTVSLIQQVRGHGQFSGQFTRSSVGEIALTLQLISNIVVNSVTVGACSLAAMFAMHVCGQFAMLYTWLDELIDEEKEKQIAESKLANIVEHHLNVLNFISRFEKIMKQTYLMQLVGCTLNLCLPDKTALGMELIISRSGVVIKITAGKLVQLSLITFGDVIKISAAYLNILRTIM